MTIVSSAQPTTFNVSGLDYTFALNFNVNGSPATELISKPIEDSNSASLIGEFGGQTKSKLARFFSRRLSR